MALMLNPRKVGLTALLVVPLAFVLLNVTPERLHWLACAIEVMKSPARADSFNQVELAIENFRRGMVNRDIAVIEKYSSPNLSFGHSNGAIQTQKEFMAAVESGAEIFKRVDITNRSLKVNGNIAVERHHFSADIIINHKTQSFELEILEIWERTDRWRLIARQAFKV